MWCSAGADAPDDLDEDGCKIGLARIREALEVVSWPVTGEPQASIPKPAPLASQTHDPTEEPRSMTDEQVRCLKLDVYWCAGGQEPIVGSWWV